MLPTVLTASLLIAIVLNGLLAGLFFAFSIAIIPGLRRVDDSTYVRSFRAINTAILNLVFLLAFCLAPLSAVTAVVLRLWSGGSGPVMWLVIAAVCSVLTFLITASANVRLNNGLDRAAVDTETQRGEARVAFEARWNRWNHVRSLTSIAALVFFTIGMAFG
ncbi:MAG: anthrone oxygenase family protein [Brevibacterium aurantiacum]|uniref:Uncharacterized protein n=2 Tax=Brevibacterium aurantiacum TaxID=273384 RepID=A0A2A3YYJ0_BREAU|nr:anthrone oxygenase family protein [Brevibacterium aurantiacum]MDN5586895.1 DUF1772 domain-containing protein [Brevibacterium sp.]AZL11035.1 DUF1772 domain-containing protein [Brevibacterium aurantiacum]MDN6374312.1 DUF1772 domain-containing protein [Brevibacterium aurantiacum]PCC44195.1 hypothetical protein CIK65_03310 [Brevibacterium aurantiacum]RCS94446.1 DUF1772 domain-containing protein [Brevibacterium aurantiacum]